MQKIQYLLEIDTLKIIESYKAPSIRQIHKILIEQLHELYIPFKNEDFIKLRSMQLHLKKLKLNDFHLYKCEQSVIKIYKLNQTPLTQQIEEIKNIA